jgi:hypothetical protein
MERLFKSGIITTLFGLGMMAVAVWLYISKEHDIETAGAVGALGFVFLRSKDSLIGLKEKK